MKFLKKMFYRLIFLGLAVALVGPFFIKEGGQSLMSVDDLIPSFAKSAVSGASSQVAAAKDILSEQTFYKWKDENGTTHITQTPPPDGVNGEAIAVNPNANILQSMSQDKIDSALGRNVEKSGGVGSKIKIPDLGSLPFGLPTSIPAEDIGSLLENAQAVQGLADDRQKMIDSLGK